MARMGYADVPLNDENANLGGSRWLRRPRLTLAADAKMPGILSNSGHS
jgi:hypothetical protein